MHRSSQKNEIYHFKTTEKEAERALKKATQRKMGVGNAINTLTFL